MPHLLPSTLVDAQRRRQRKLTARLTGTDGVLDAGVTPAASERPVHHALRTGVAALVAAAVLESGLAVGGQSAGVQFVDGEDDAGLPAAQVRRQFGCLPRCGVGGEGAQPPSLLLAVDREAAQEPGG